MNRMRDLLDEEVHEFPEHERAPVAGSPATPTHGLAFRLAYGLWWRQLPSRHTAETPLLNLHWLGRGDVARFVALLLAAWGLPAL